MKISLSWLQKHIQIQKNFEDIADKLTFAGLEVEHFYEKSSVEGGLKGLVVGEVITCNPIPDTDKLKLTEISIGGKEDLLQIVCGAPNVEQGQKVVVAQVGTTIYPIGQEPFTIRKAKIRGVQSFGMLCAEDEIGLGESHEGILVLPQNSEPGAKLSQLYNISTETIIDIGLTANRGDAASHRGVARDIAALENKTLEKMDCNVTYGNSNSPISIDVQHSDCPRYAGVAIDNVAIKESPDWLKNALKSIDIEPINNVVDATNYVLHDLGQPIHAFDAEKIEGDTIIVRKAVDGEKLITLDDKERDLKSTDLIIADKSKPMALAGVFGGAHSGINSNTKSIFIESAYFNPVSIRKTAKSFALNTDASYRYERGADPNIVHTALDLVAKLIIELTGGEAKYHKVEHYPEEIKDFNVELKVKNIKRILGIEIPQNRVLEILEALEIKVTKTDDQSFHLEIPPFKSDVTREIDVIEEIIRIYGFDKIPLKASTSIFNSSFEESPLFDTQLRTKQILRGMGFTEIMTNSMINDDSEDAVKILNPLSKDTSAMRTNLEFGMIQTIAYNVNRKNNLLKFFEIGTIFNINGEGKIKEQQQLAVACFGNVFNESWQFSKQKTDEFFLNNIIQELLSSFGIAPSKMKKYITKAPHEFNINQFKQFKIKGKVFLALLDFTKIINHTNKPLKVKDIIPYPKIRRDLSLVVKKEIQYDEIKKITLQTCGHLLKEMNVFDVYEGKPLDSDKKSYSVSYIWQSDKETLQDSDIDQKMNSLIEKYGLELDAVIRK